MKKFGIDVSHWQGNFNMDQAKSEGAEFVIIKAGGADKRLYKDSMFESNYSKAAKCGMNKGAYFFGYAFDIHDAVKEARFFMKLLKGKKFEYPVFYDVEGKMLKQDKKTLTDIVIAFCEEMENNGYYVGVYTSESCYNSVLDDRRLAPYTHWTAKYNKNKPALTSGNASAMWQFGGEKNYIRNNRIAGVVCDQNYCYVDYPAVIIKKGMNGYGVENTEPDRPHSAVPVIRVGMTVRVVNPVNYNGARVTAWFNNKGYKVAAIKGDRAVLEYNGELFDAFHLSDLEII